jgi:prepilin-type N-terminal cleavage/methylation domain-containing protein
MMESVSRRQRGFTLIELLVAIVSMVVILGAAAGLAIAAIARQKIAFDASRLEANHGELANTISNAIKTADRFQIFDSANSVKISRIGSYGIGAPSGNYLSCQHNFSVSAGHGEIIEQDFELVRGTPGGSGTLVQTVRFLSTSRPEIRREFSGIITTEPFFSMKNGIPQAHWRIATTLDRVDFNVYAMPLSMR